MNVAELAFKEHLRHAGVSITEPRKLVFAALDGQEALSMSQLVAACPSLDRATIYRTVALFEELGIAQRLQIGWKYKIELTDSFTHHHHHLTCVRCGKIIPLAEDLLLEDRLQELARDHHFVAEDHQIEVRGVCRQCQQADIA